jgi:hypothetical protein
MGAFPENQDPPYGTDDERAGEPAADVPVLGEGTRRLALPELALSEAQSQGRSRYQFSCLIGYRSSLGGEGGAISWLSRTI